MKNEQSVYDTRIHTALAGAIAGLSSAILVCPLDVLKVRLQNQPNPSHTGPFATLVRIATEEGYRGLFAGLRPTVLSYLCDRAIWFTSYEVLKDSISTTLEISRNDSKTHISATFLSSFICLVATCPLWVIRTRMMTQDSTTPYNYTSITCAMRTMIRKEGVLSLYKGFGPSFFGIIHPVIQFPLYERIKINISKYENTYTPTDRRPHLSNTGILLASITSKCVAGLLTYPHEVIRTRIQTQTTGERGVWRGILRHEGWKGFYKGLGTNLIRSIPSSAVSLWCYEWLCRGL